MINNFTSVITWFKDISSSLLAWFFDTSNTNKVLLFVVPLFVIAAIFVLFDFIVPMFYDLPRWRLNRQLAVMTPKNTYGLAINKHLIPRTPYSLRRMFMVRFSGGIIKGYNSKTLKAFSTKDIKPFQSRDLKGFKVSDLKGYKVYDFRNFKTADIRVLKSNDLRSLTTSEMRSFTPDKIADFNIKPISTIKLGGLNPAEMRSFKVSEIRAIRPNDIRRMHLNSHLVGSHLIDGRSIGGLTPRNYVGRFTPAVSIKGSANMVDSKRTSMHPTDATKAALKAGMDSFRSTNYSGVDDATTELLYGGIDVPVVSDDDNFDSPVDRTFRG